MRALRFLALAAALVVPAAAAHAQVGIYIGHPHRYVAPVYGAGYGVGYGVGYPGYLAPGYFAPGPVVYGGGYWAGGRWEARPGWRDHRGWDRGRVRYDHERRW